MADNFNFTDYHTVAINNRTRTVPEIKSDSYETRAFAGDPITPMEIHSRLWVVWSRFFQRPIGRNACLMDSFFEVDHEGVIVPDKRDIQDGVPIHFVPILFRGPPPPGAQHPLRAGDCIVHEWNYWSAAWVTSMHPHDVFVLQTLHPDVMNQCIHNALASVEWKTQSTGTEEYSRRREVVPVEYNLPDLGTVNEASGWMIVNAFAELLLNLYPSFVAPVVRIPFSDFINISKLKTCMTQNFIIYESTLRDHAERRPAANDEAEGFDEDALRAAEVVEQGELAMMEHDLNICCCCNSQYPPGRDRRDPHNLLQRCSICQLSFHEHCAVNGERCLREHVSRGHRIWLCHRCQHDTPGYRPVAQALQQERPEREQLQQEAPRDMCSFCGNEILSQECYIPCHADECSKIYHTHCAIKTEGFLPREIAARKKVIETPRRLLSKRDKDIEAHYDKQFLCPECRAAKRLDWIYNRIPQPPIPFLDYIDEGGTALCDRCGKAKLFSWERQANIRLCCGTVNTPVYFATEQHVIPASIRSLHQRHPHALARYSRLINSMVSIASIACLQLVNAEGRLVSRVTGGVSQQINATTLTPEGHLEAVGVIAHFGLSHRGARNNPLIGNILSYIFPEPTKREVSLLTIRIDGEYVRLPSMSVDFVRESRRIFRLENPYFQQAFSMVNVDETRTLAGNFDDRSIVEYLGPNYVDRDRIPSVAWHATAFRFTDPITRNTVATAFSIDNNSAFRPVTTGRLGGTNIVQFDHNNPWYDAFVYPLLDLYGRTSYCAGKKIGPVICGTPGETLYRVRPFMPISWMKHLRAKVMQLEMFQLCPDITHQLVLDRVSMHYQIDARNREFFARQKGFRIDNPEERPVRRVYDPIRHLHLVHHTVRGSMQERTYHVEQGCALVKKFGHPTLFITMTSNENWPEFRREMIPGTEWHQNIPLLCRVFKRKLDLLIQGLWNGKYFGRKAIWIQYKVEFQKRGKPHAHILAKLEGCDELLPEEVDQMVSAELPRCPAVPNYEDPKSVCGDRHCKHCKLRAQVMVYMIHNHRPDRCHKKKPRRKNDTEPEDIVEDHERCELRYPFPPQAETAFGAFGRWAYKRSPLSGWVVPYSPQLISEFDCHINTEVAAGSRCVYYLQKYFAKIHDTVSAKVDFQPGSTRLGQITQFFQLRYLCVGEAYWQLYGYPFVYFSPKVTSIYVNPNPRHQLQEQLDLYDPGPENEGEAGPPVEFGLTRDLQMYFNRPLFLEECTIVDFYASFDVRRMTQPEIDGGDHPYNLLGSYRKFRLVKRRCVHVVCFRYKSLKDMERFCFTLLLENIPARSKTALRTVDGVQYATYEQACKERRIFEEDAAGVYRRLFFELDLHQMPLETFLLAAKTFLLDNPALFFDFFDNQKMFRFLLSPSDRAAVDQDEEAMFAVALTHFTKFCYSENILLREMIDKVDPRHPLGAKLDRIIGAEVRQSLLRQQFRHNVSDFREENTLNDEQTYVFQQIVHHFNEWKKSQGRVPAAMPMIWWKNIHYINGMAGTGKTTLVRNIMSFFAGEGFSIAASAYTGIAALELPRARTCHSLYGIPIKLDESKMPEAENIDLGFEDHAAQLRRGVLNLGDVELTRREVLGSIRIHIVDEVSLLSRLQLDFINEVLKQAATYAEMPNSADPFGGAFVILAGDFHQTVPILNKPSPEARRNDKKMNELILNETILNHPLFRSPEGVPTTSAVEFHQLCRPERFCGNSKDLFVDFISKVAKGTAGANFDPTREDCVAHFSIPVKNMPPLFHKNVYYSLGDAVRSLPGERRNSALQMMAPHHRAVQLFNRLTVQENVDKRRIGDLKHIAATYCDVRQLHQDDFYDPGLLADLARFECVDLPRDPPHTLELAVGMPIILLRNMCVNVGLTNGAIYIIEHLRVNYLQARSLRNPGDVRQLWRMRLTMTCGMWEFKRLQYPVRPAYGITINKSQGKTLTGATILHLQEDCFSHGQLYVALTRLRNPEELRLVVKNRERSSDIGITNYVLLDVLEKAGLLPQPM